MAQVLTYPNVTEYQWGKIKTVLAQNGVNITSDSGEVKTRGVDATYSYAEPELTVTVIDAPWFMGVVSAASILDAKIKAELT